MAPTERDIQILSAMQAALTVAIDDNHTKLMSLRTAPRTRSLCQVKQGLMQEQFGALEKAIGMMKKALPGRAESCGLCDGTGYASASAGGLPVSGHCGRCLGQGYIDAN